MLNFLRRFWTRRDPHRVVRIDWPTDAKEVAPGLWERELRRGGLARAVAIDSGMEIVSLPPSEMFDWLEDHGYVPALGHGVWSR